MEKMFKKAHKMVRGIKKEYPEVDYRTQFGICLSYLIENEEESEMTMEKWYESLTEKEKSRLKDGFENRTYMKPVEEREKIWNALLEEKYQKHLKEIEWERQREEERKQQEEEEEKQRQINADRGYMTIELYQSNRYRCWAAEVIRTDEKYGLARKFINPVEIKGNYKIYELKEGKCYNYLNNNKQHFAKVENGELVEIAREEMIEAVR